MNNEINPQGSEAQHHHVPLWGHTGNVFEVQPMSGSLAHSGPAGGTSVARRSAAAEDRANLEHARPMLFETRPSTPEANLLVEVVAKRIADREHQSGSRKYQRRGRKQDQHVAAIGKVLGDLLIAAARDPERWSARGTRPIGFTGLPVSHRSYMAIRKELLGLGFIEEHGYYFERDEEGWSIWRSRRVRATRKLLQIAASAGINIADAERHFPVGLPRKPLVLKASSQRIRGRKVSGGEMRFAETPRTQEMVAEIRELDRFIAEHTLEGGLHRGYRRIFNQGDLPGFRWNKGGRLYSVEHDNYQTLEKEQRRQMLIDGQGVVEIDITASHLTILYAQLGKPLNLSRDPYSIPGLPRDVAKACVTMMLGNRGPLKRWPAGVRAEMSEKGIDLKRFKLRDVQEKVLAVHSILGSFAQSGIDSFDLMYLESEAIIATMLALKREHGIICLSVHDSILVPAAAEPIAKQVLETEYARVVGVTPSLKVKRPTPRDDLPKVAA